jgi:cytolysin-activating lysine-acyltransferase
MSKDKEKNAPALKASKFATEADKQRAEPTPESSIAALAAAQGANAQASSSSGQTPEQNAARRADLQKALGAAVSLMGISGAHQHLFVADFQWAVLPPLALRQYRLFRNDKDQVVGYASWALLNDEAQERVKKHGFKLRPNEWKSGEHAWLADIVAPFGGAEQMARQLKRQLFKDKPLHTIRPDPQTGKPQIITVEDAPTTKKED